MSDDKKPQIHHIKNKKYIIDNIEINMYVIITTKKCTVMWEHEVAKWLYRQHRKPMQYGKLKYIETIKEWFMRIKREKENEQKQKGEEWLNTFGIENEKKRKKEFETVMKEAIKKSNDINDLNYT